MTDKTKIITFIIILIIMIIILPVLSSIFTDFLEVYKFNLSLIPENLIKNTARDAQTYLNFFTKTCPTNILGWGVIGLFLIYSLLIYGKILIHRYLNEFDIPFHY